jgi:hypothetical protein
MNKRMAVPKSSPYKGEKKRKEEGRKKKKTKTVSSIPSG